MGYQTLKVRFEASSSQSDDDICFLQLFRPDANNTINGQMINELHEVSRICREKVKILILEGLPEVFCFGADFQAMAKELSPSENSAETLYDVWLDLATGPYLSIAHVRGKVNAGGVGFVAASDIVLADTHAEFSLSELLFGLFPACVLPFLIRRVGFQRAHTITLMTKPVNVEQASDWGLVDAFSENSSTLLKQHLLRFRRLNKTAIQRYKSYMNELDNSLVTAKSKALSENLKMFSDKTNIDKITRYVSTGKFPWEL